MTNTPTAHPDDPHYVDRMSWLRAAVMGANDGIVSVGGLITSRIGRIPRPGEEVVVDYHGLRFRVLQMGERRVERVFCSRVPAAGEKKTTENSAESAKEEQTTT